MADPFKTHLTALRNVRSRLDWGLAMSGRQVLLHGDEQTRARRAAEKINDAIRILSGID